jgi:hypothetical protein
MFYQAVRVRGNEGQLGPASSLYGHTLLSRMTNSVHTTRNTLRPFGVGLYTSFAAPRTTALCIGNNFKRVIRNFGLLRVILIALFGATSVARGRGRTRQRARRASGPSPFSGPRLGKLPEARERSFRGPEARGTHIPSLGKPPGGDIVCPRLGVCNSRGSVGAQH